MRLAKKEVQIDEHDLGEHSANDNLEHWISYHSGVLDETDIEELRSIINELVNESLQTEG